MTLLGCGKPPAAGESFSLTYVSNALDNADLTTYTYASQDIGTVSASRRIIYGMLMRGAAGTAITQTSTLGGNAASSIISAANNGGGGNSIEIYGIDESVNTSATIDGTASRAMLRSALAVANVKGFSGSANTASQTGLAATSINFDLVVPTGGAGFVFAFTSNSTSLGISGTGVSENASQALEFGIARSATLSTAGTITVTATAGGASDMLMVGVAYGP